MMSGYTAMLCLLPAFLALPLVIAQYLLRLTAKRYLNSRLGGYTGDCCGALTLLCELSFYMGIVLVYSVTH